MAALQSLPTAPRVVHVKRGQTAHIDAGGGVRLALEREPSGAVTLRNLLTGHVLRQWSPKEARQP